MTYYKELGKKLRQQHNEVIEELETVENESVKRKILTTILTDNTDFIIPLCSLDNTDANANYYFSGNIFLKRYNMASQMASIEITCGKMHNTTLPYCFMASNDIKADILVRPVTFTYNGKIHFGLYFSGVTAYFSEGYARGESNDWSVIDCIAVYNNNTKTTINEEVYNSITYIAEEQQLPKEFYTIPQVNPNGDGNVYKLLSENDIDESPTENSHKLVTSEGIRKAINEHSSNNTHITSTERTNWNNAYNKKHEHTNKADLDMINTNSIIDWNAAYTHSQEIHPKIGYTTSGKNYAVQLDSDNKMYVNVPWTDNNTVYNHPTSSGNKHIPSGGSSGQILRWSADGTAVWGDDNNTTYSAFSGATSSVAGSSGLVPQPVAGKQNSFLRGDGTWAIPTNTTYSTATSSAAGLVKIGYNKSGKNYPVELNSDGQMYVNVPWTDNNTTYTNFKLGQGYGTCTTDADDKAKIVSLSGYVLNVGGIVVVKFTNAVPADSTLNINNAGAKTIRYKGSNITNEIIHAGDTVSFMYNGGYYHIISIDKNGYVPITDRRDTNETPEWYMTNYPKQVINEFKFTSAIGLSGEIFVNLVTDTPWGEYTGGYPKQHAICNGILYIRQGTSSTTWSAWKAQSDTSHTHNTATSDTAGLVKIGYTTSGKNYAVQLSDGQMYVNVPWTDNNTTYSNATTSTAGLMSASDKSKLDGVASGANNYSHPTYTAKSSGLYKVTVDSTGHVSGTTAVTKSDITALGIPSSDTNTTTTAGASNTSSKIFLVGATSQATNPQTYSHDTVYVGTDGHLYSNSKQAVNLSDSQALTNKTYNGYTLGAACAKGVDTTATSGSGNLITSGAMYTALSGKANYKVKSSADFNTMTTPGLYTIHTSAISSPTGDGYYSLIVNKPSTGSYVHQIAIKDGSCDMYIRYLYGSSWSSWKRVAISDDLESKLYHTTITTATDFNTLKTTGIYHIAVAGCTSTPIAAWGTLYVDFIVGTPYQIYIPDGQSQVIYKRGYSNSTWTKWRPISNSTKLVFAASDSCIDDKVRADVVLSGSDDRAEIMTWINGLAWNSNFEVHFCAGTYNLKVNSMWDGVTWGNTGKYIGIYAGVGKRVTRISGAGENTVFNISSNVTNKPIYGIYTDYGVIVENLQLKTNVLSGVSSICLLNLDYYSKGRDIFFNVSCASNVAKYFILGGSCSLCDSINLSASDSSCPINIPTGDIYYRAMLNNFTSLDLPANVKCNGNYSKVTNCSNTKITVASSVIGCVVTNNTQSTANSVSGNIIVNNL